jgi:hypothetical protein
MKNSNDTIGNQSRGLSFCSATACPHLSMYLIKLSLTQMVVAMANLHYFTAGGKSNCDTDRRSLSVVSVSGERVKCVTALSLLQAQCFRHKT